MKWKCQTVQCVRVSVPETEYDKKLAELARILYATFCQLEAIDLISRELNATSVSSSSPSFSKPETASDMKSAA